MIKISSIFIVAFLLVQLSKPCIEVPEGSFVYYSRYIFSWIVNDGHVGECWYIDEDVNEPERGEWYIKYLDPSAVVFSSPVSPIETTDLRKKIYLPIIWR